MKFKKLQVSEGGNFLKIKDGESVIGVPAGEIFSLKIKWENGRSVTLNEPDESKHNRFKMNFIVKDGNNYSSKIWEFGVTIYNTLAEFAKEMDLTKTKIKVTRAGTGTDTLYTLIPLGLIDPKTFAGVELNILDANKVPELPPMPDQFPEELPF